ERELHSGGGFHREAEEAKRTPGSHSRVELAERPRRSVARVGEDRLPLGDPLFVELLEAVEGEVALAADLDELRGIALVQAERDVAHGAQVRRHILADPPVPARGSGDEHPVAVCQTDRGAVYLELRRV